MTVELICPFCHFSKQVPKEKIPAGTKRATCPRCGQGFEFSLSRQDMGHVAEGSGSSVKDEGDIYIEGSSRMGAPWERRADLGLWPGIYLTFKAVLFSPQDLFGSLSFKDGIGEPLAFGLLVGSLGSMFGFFWQFLALSSGLSFFGQFVFGHLTVGLLFLIIMVIIPAVVTIGMLIYSSILHLCLLIVRGGRNGFEATFRVVCYSQAAQAWGLIPVVGGWVGGIWQLTVQIIGLREIHETSGFRVFCAFLIPVVIVLSLVIVVLISLFTYLNQQLFGQV